MNDEQKNAVDAYTRWLYNAKPDFIEEAWKGQPMMIMHLKKKLLGLIHRYGDFMSLEALARFTRELDTTNWCILLDYIIKNHFKKWES